MTEPAQVTQFLDEYTTSPSHEQTADDFESAFTTRLAEMKTIVTQRNAQAVQINAVGIEVNALAIAVSTIASDAEQSVIDCEVQVTLAESAVSDAEEYVDEILTSQVFNATSVSSVSIGTGDKTFILAEQARGYTAGSSVRISETADPSTNSMEGIVKSYNDGTDILIVTVSAVGGAGTISAWSIGLLAGGDASSLDGYTAAELRSMDPDTKEDGDSITTADLTKFLSVAGTFSLPIAAAATLGPGGFFWINNTGTGDITTTPNGAETINGAASFVVAAGVITKFYTDGSNLFTVPANSKVVLDSFVLLTSGTSWVCPAGVIKARLKQTGGGGGGTISGSNSVIPSGGSAGALDAFVDLVPGTTYTYAIGAAGANGPSSTDGGTTTITIGGVLYTTTGGKKGGGAGGDGGNGGTASGTGALLFTGQKGFGYAQSGYSGDGCGIGGASMLGHYGRGGNGGYSGSKAGIQGAIILELYK